MFCFQNPPVYSENAVPMVPVHNEYQQQQQQQPMSLPPMANTTSQIDQEFTQINQQIQGLSLQYQNQSYEYGTVGAETAQNSSGEMNNYGESTNQYAQSNLYEPTQQQQQTDYYGHSQQNDSVANNSAGYAEQQMYQQQTFNDPLNYGSPSYGAAEVIFTIFFFLF